MELVILTIGLELGVISPALFTMMVLMALITTAMTTPILEWLYPARLIRETTAAEAAEPGEYTVLLPISLPSSGPGLLRAARLLAPEGRQPRAYALHLQRSSDTSLSRVDLQQRPADDEVLRPLLDAAAAEDVEVRALSFTSRNVGQDIVDVARAKQVDLVLMGWHKPVLGGSILSGTANTVLRSAQVDVAVLVDRGPAPWRRILVPYRNPTEDLGALDMARRIATRGDVEVTILHVPALHGPVSAADRLASRWEEHAFPEGVRLKVVESANPLDAAVHEAQQGYDLIVVGVSSAWGTKPSTWDTVPSPFGRRHERLARATNASLLVVRSRAARSAAAATIASAAATEEAAAS
jgi:nucleotide-binding universal stress UspA family protein